MLGIWRLATQLSVASAAAAVATVSFAQNYPNKAIRLVIGYGAGGVTDVLNRVVADELGKRLGQTVIVENRPGAAALVAATAVKTAAPDGYTLYGGSVTSFNPIFLKSGMDASKELTPISTFAFGDYFLYTPTSIGVGNLKELAAYGKANPGKVRFSAPATANTLLFTLVAKRLGFEFENIQYKTSDQTIAALLQGDGTATANAISGFEPHVQAGKLKIVMTFSPNRSPVQPAVPTAREQGVDFAVRFNIGMWGPQGLASDIVGRLNAMTREALSNPVVAERIRNAALSPTPATPAEMLRDFENEVAFYKEAIAISGYQPQ